MLFVVKERLEGLTYNIEFFGEGVGYTGGGDTVLDFREKILGPAGPQVFIFCRQNKYSGRQKLY